MPKHEPVAEVATDGGVEWLQSVNVGDALFAREAVKAGWLEAAIAWEVCGSLHREYCKGRDPFYKTRQSDFTKHADDARAKAEAP